MSRTLDAAAGEIGCIAMELVGYADGSAKLYLTEGKGEFRGEVMHLIESFTRCEEVYNEAIAEKRDRELKAMKKLNEPPIIRRRRSN